MTCIKCYSEWAKSISKYLFIPFFCFRQYPYAIGGEVFDFDDETVKRLTFTERLRKTITTKMYANLVVIFYNNDRIISESYWSLMALSAKSEISLSDRRVHLQSARPRGTAKLNVSTTMIFLLFSRTGVTLRWYEAQAFQNVYLQRDEMQAGIKSRH